MTARLTVHRERPRHAAVATSRGAIAGRECLLLRVETDSGTGLGEASPLAGYGRDSLDRARRDLARLRAAPLESAARSLGNQQDFEPLEQLSGSLASPSARHAVETCALELASQLAGLPAWSLLSHGGQAPHQLVTSQVLDPLHEGLVQRVACSPSRTFKLKCGRDLEREWAAVVSLAAWSEHRASLLELRIDPNAAWSLEQALEFARRSCALQAEFLRIQWIEDPTADPRNWRQIRQSTAVAADEFLVTADSPSRFLDEVQPDVIVLKPMAVGGSLRCLRWARLALDRNVRCVVSHLFDGPVALDAACELAFALACLDRRTPLAPGLGLHRGLQGWSRQPRWASAELLRRPTAPPESPHKGQRR